MKKATLFNLKKRGKLELVESSENIRDSYIQKSESNWNSANILMKAGKFEDAVPILYYSAYNSILSLLFSLGIKSENHDASLFLLKEIFNIDNAFVSSLKDERVGVQYYVDFNLKKNEIEEMFVEVNGFNSSIRDFVSKLNNEKIKEYRNKFESLFEDKYGKEK